jgi:hypothetical protein
MIGVMEPVLGARADCVFTYFDARAGTTATCRSVAFFRTSVYTRFFSLADALRINSENEVDARLRQKNRVIGANYMGQ